jgi:REP element-mobilizing transposase RayT
MGIYQETFYHVVWSTKNRAPLIKIQQEKDLYAYISRKVQELRGVLLGINGTEDHVHLLATIPPAIAVAQFIMRIKGASSHFMNRSKGSKEFYWQEGYGVISLSRKAIPFVRDYVRNQKKHHTDGTMIARLERWEGAPGAETSGLKGVKPSEGG